MRVCSCCSKALDESQFVKRALPDADVCKPCRQQRSRDAYNAKNHAKVTAHARLMYTSNRETRIARQAAWKKANPDKVKEYRKKSYERNPQAWKVAARKREFVAAQRTPRWDTDLTSLVFAEAVDLRLRRGLVTGTAWEIDHEVPLQGKRVSGLHVWNNLRVIPQALNRRKFNSYDIV